MSPGQEIVVSITLDTEDANPNDCPPAEYDADILAAVDGTALGGATIRFDWDGTPP